MKLRRRDAPPAVAYLISRETVGYFSDLWPDLTVLGIAGSGSNDSRLQSRAPDSQRDWRDWLAGQTSIRRRSCCVAWQAALLYLAAAVRHRSIEAGHSQLAAYLIGFMALSAAGVGVFAYPHPLHNIFGISEFDRLPGTTGAGADMETRLAGKRPCFLFLGFLSAYMHRNRFGLELALQTRTGLGARETCLWPGTKSPFRCLVRLVRRCWFVIVPGEMIKASYVRENRLSTYER